MTWVWFCVAAVILTYVCYGAFLFVRAKQTTTRVWSIPTHVAIASFISSSLVTFVLLIVAVRSLQISLVALDEANKTAQQQNSANTQQLKALDSARQAILTTSSQQQVILDKSHQALEDQLVASRNQTKTVEKMLYMAQEQQSLLTQQLETMRAQTAVLEEQWNRANEKPAIAVLTISIGGPSGHLYMNITPYGELSTQAGRFGSAPPYEIPFSIRNIGTAALRKPKVTAYIESPAHYECVYFRSYGLNGDKPCDLPPVELPDLLPDPGGSDISYTFKPRALDQNFFVYYTIPDNAEHVVIHLTVSGENLTAATYSVSAKLSK